MPAAEGLLPLVYTELRRVAAAEIARERRRHFSRRHSFMKPGE
jgi:hypothetical protein